jgi:DNA-binding transcriptional regulator LsrR (DeoR family)
MHSEASHAIMAGFDRRRGFVHRFGVAALTGQPAMRDRRDAKDLSGFRSQDRRRDLAVRAAWLYYVAGNTQDQLASKLNVSRQAAQRLVASAVAEGLITFRIDHPLRVCVELEEALRTRYRLDYAEVVPGDADQDGVIGVGAAAARQLEAHLSPRPPTVLAFGTGRTLRSAVSQVEPIERPQHKIVSLVGTTTRDGRATAFEVVMRLAERIGAACYPVPTSVVTDTIQERAQLENQRPWQLIRALADSARMAMFGIGTLERGKEAPLLRDGFITEAEHDELILLGAVGDITGWAFDARGCIIEGGSNARLTAIPHRLPLERLTIGVAGGQSKIRAIAAALEGRLISGLITDEAAARGILER